MAVSRSSDPSPVRSALMAHRLLWLRRPTDAQLHRVLYEQTGLSVSYEPVGMTRDDHDQPGRFAPRSEQEGRCLRAYALMSKDMLMTTRTRLVTAIAPAFVVAGILVWLGLYASSHYNSACRVGPTSPPGPPFNPPTCPVPYWLGWLAWVALIVVASAGVVVVLWMVTRRSSRGVESPRSLENWWSRRDTCVGAFRSIGQRYCRTYDRSFQLGERIHR